MVVFTRPGPVACRNPLLADERACKRNALLEATERDLKRIANLQIRPVHHWLTTRVRAHVFLCMLAYYVEFHMRRALAPMLFTEHAPEARERKSAVASAQASPAGIEKRTRRRSADGQAVLAWPNLLAHLATLTLNEVVLPMKGTATFAMPARPAALQEKAFVLLGLPLPCIQ